MLADALSAECLKSLTGDGLSLLAHVLDEDSVDVAIKMSAARLAVVRCVARPSEADHHALKTMIAEGDFDRAFLVHSDECSPPPGDIPTYPISRIHELAALLAKGELP